MRLRCTGGFSRFLRRVGIGQRDRRTVRSELPHDRCADAPGAAENKCDFIRKLMFLRHRPLHY